MPRSSLPGAAPPLDTTEPPPRRERQRPRFELRCASCGYGAVVRVIPAHCPICRGSVWEHPPRPPSRRARPE